MLLKTRHKIRLAALAYHSLRAIRSLLGLSATGRFRRNGFLWELDLNEVVDFMIYLSGSFEPRLNAFLRHHLKPGQVAVDIGANIGAHSLTMASAVGAEGTVYAIEATEYAYRKLCQNIELNPQAKHTRAMRSPLSRSDLPHPSPKAPAGMSF